MFTVGEAASIPFDPERFDVVVAVTILCFVANAAPVFKEVARVLRPGGVMVIGELGNGAAGGGARVNLLSATEMGGASIGSA